MTELELMFEAAHKDTGMDEMLDKYNVDEQGDVEQQMKSIIISEGESCQEAHADFYAANPNVAPSSLSIEWFWIAWYMAWRKLWDNPQWV